jgi:hypothetical protein
MAEFQPVEDTHTAPDPYVSVGSSGKFYVSPPLFQSRLAPTEAVAVSVNESDAQVAIEATEPASDDPSVSSVSLSESGGGLFTALAALNQTGVVLDERVRPDAEWNEKTERLVVKFEK